MMTDLAYWLIFLQELDCQIGLEYLERNRKDSSSAATRYERLPGG